MFLNLTLVGTMAYLPVRGRGPRFGGGLGRGRGSKLTPSRRDNNIFAVLSEDYDQDGDWAVICDDKLVDSSCVDINFDPDNGWKHVVRSKQTKRQRISSSGQSGHDSDVTRDQMEVETGDYDSLSKDDKLSLVLSKLSINEQRVKYIQTKVDSVLPVKKRVAEIENVLRSHSERLKLLEYRSLDIEARSRRRNLLFKGVPENKYENCFVEARRFIREKLRIEQDMYLEIAHRLGRYDPSKTRPIIVAFRDFCDIDYILQEASNLKGTELGVSRDYPNEISKARQSLWKQFKDTRENNPRKKVTFGYPASILVNGVTVVDLFPDWYDILKGSRISYSANQSNQQAVSGDRQKTGLAGSQPEPRATSSNACPRDNNTGGANTPDKQSPMTGTDFSGRDLTESDSENDSSQPLSQSLLAQLPPSVAHMSTPMPKIDPKPSDEHFVKPRGRSVTKRENANKTTGPKRSQSQKPRGRPRTKSNQSDRSASTNRPRSEKATGSRPPSLLRGEADPPNPQRDDQPQPPGQSDENSA